MDKNRKIAEKILILILSVLLCCETLPLKAQAARTITDTTQGSEDGYDFELWKDYGNTEMQLNGSGEFSCSWSDINNALFRKGIKYDCTKTYYEIGDITVEYSCDYRPDGNSYMCVYGWCREPLVEYYIVDSWGTWRPPGGVSKGQITIDGGTYDVYETTRIEQPSIDGTQTFQQYWSVRTEKRTSGTINVCEHFRQWEKLGLKMGKMYEAAFTIEGYQSRGSAKVTKNIISVKPAGSTTDSGNNNTNRDSNNTNRDNDSPDLKTTKYAKLPKKLYCRNATLSGPYAGLVFSPFNGVALYANKDAVTATIKVKKGKYNISLRGCSGNNKKASADLYVNGKKAGTYTFTGTKIRTKTIKNVRLKKGVNEIRVELSKDDGSWDIFLNYIKVNNYVKN